MKEKECCFRTTLDRDKQGDAMLLFGAHLINHGSFDADICCQIVTNSGLLSGTNSWFGSGVYAYYPDKVPVRYRGCPFVVFQAFHMRSSLNVRDIHIDNSPNKSDAQFFLLPISQGSIVPVAIFGFVDCPGFSAYPGTLAYI